jgi:hypothetical protein
MKFHEIKVNMKIAEREEGRYLRSILRKEAKIKLELIKLKYENYSKYLRLLKKHET